MSEWATTPDARFEKKTLRVVDFDAMGELGENIKQTLTAEKEAEHEFRFLMHAAPGMNSFSRMQVIRQGYFTGIFTDKDGNRLSRTIRVRDAWNHEQGSRYRVNYKDRIDKKGRARRMEHGGKIMDAWFPELWKYVGDNTVTKVRLYDELHGRGHDVHVDAYVDPPGLVDLAVAEFEFTTDDDANKFDRKNYPWLGRELTQKRGWGNSAIAVNGLPKSPGLSKPDISVRKLVTFARGIYEGYKIHQLNRGL